MFWTPRPIQRINTPNCQSQKYQIHQILQNTKQPQPQMLFFNLLDIILTAALLKVIAGYIFSKWQKRVQMPIQPTHARGFQSFGCPRLQAFRTCPTSAATPKGCPCPQAAAQKPKPTPSNIQTARISFLFKPTGHQSHHASLFGQPAAQPVPATAQKVPATQSTPKSPTQPPHSFKFTETEFILRADVPGVKQGELQVTVTDDTRLLTVSGTSPTRGSIELKAVLPRLADLKNISAVVADGELVIKVAKLHMDGRLVAIETERLNKESLPSKPQDLNRKDSETNQPETNQPSKTQQLYPKIPKQPQHAFKNLDKEFLVSVDIPGFKQNELTLTVTNDTRIMSLEGASRSGGLIKLAVGIPRIGDLDNIQAKVEDGVLTLRIPKLERDGRLVPVTAATGNVSPRPSETPAKPEAESAGSSVVPQATKSEQDAPAEPANKVDNEDEHSDTDGYDVIV
ncbi:hypothetical protein BJ741DRAFT_94115 [Chytriomyces cf. hyalinus JEL632]|nr:hypothetical protein BJ741DRAFT_94115 [Chytriomyces cf. hyalinus JEL632]